MESDAASKDSGECIISQLSFFSKPPLLSAISEQFFETLFPVAPLSDSNDIIEFNLEAQDCFISLAESLISLKVKIVQDDGTPLPAGEVVSLIDYPLNSLWKNVDFRLNNQSLTSCYSTYAYLAYLETYLEASRDYRTSKGQASGIYTEDDKTNIAWTLPCGFRERGALFAESRIASFCGIFHHPLANQPRFMIPLLGMSWSFQKQPASFVIKAEEDKPYRYTIVDMRLHVKKVRMSSDFQVAFERQFKNDGLCFYNISQNQIKDYTISAGLASYNIEAPFLASFVPNRVYVMLVKQQAFLGSMQTDPMDFQTFNLMSMRWLMDGRSYPSSQWTTQFGGANPDYTEAFLSLFNYDLRSNGGNAVDMSNFLTGWAIFSFSLGQPQACSDGELTFPRKLSTPRLSMQFRTPLVDPIKVLIMSKSDELLAIDSLRTIHRNYNL